MLTISRISSEARGSIFETLEKIKLFSRTSGIQGTMHLLHFKLAIPLSISQLTGKVAVNHKLDLCIHFVVSLWIRMFFLSLFIKTTRRNNHIISTRCSFPIPGIWGQNTLQLTHQKVFETRKKSKNLICEMQKNCKPLTVNWSSVDQMNGVLLRDNLKEMHWNQTWVYLFGINNLVSCTWIQQQAKLTAYAHVDSRPERSFLPQT